MKYLLLTFDVEEFVRPIEKNLEYDEKELFEVSRNGLERIIQILKSKDVKATFFVTHDFSMRYKGLIKRIIKERHEIGLHAYKHNDNYAGMDDEEVYKLLKRAKDGLEGEFKIRINGFRSPQLQFVSPDVLNKLGIKYDSSFHPTYVPGKYFHAFGKRGLFKEDGVIVVPISVAAGLRLPFSWIWFRNFGLGYAKFCTRLALMNSMYINIYFHPWDFADLSSYRKEIGGLYVRNSGENLARDIERYIDFCKSKGLVGSTMIDFLKKEPFFELFRKSLTKREKETPGKENAN